LKFKKIHPLRHSQFFSALESGKDCLPGKVDPFPKAVTQTKPPGFHPEVWPWYRSPQGTPISSSFLKMKDDFFQIQKSVFHLKYRYL
jgi:hypothetical protein